MGLRIGELGRHVAVVVAYGVIYSLLKALGFAHFVPVAGFKLAVLLLLPRRYWLALLISETSILAYGLSGSITAYGWSFYLAAIVPPIALLMPAVMICRSNLGGMTFPHFRLSSVLICAIASTVILVVDALLVATLIPASSGIGQKPLEQLATDYFLGTYTGIVAVMPVLVTAALEWHENPSLRALWAKNREMLIALGVTLLAVVLEVSALKSIDYPMLRFGGQALLFVPAAYFSLKWGWRGAAVIGAVASFAIASLMPAKFDVATLSSQTMMALFVTTFIVLGVQTTKLKRALWVSENHLKKARFEQHLSEVRLQRSSFELSWVNEELTRAHNHLLIELGDGHNRGEVNNHKRVLSKTTSRLHDLASSLAPPMGAGHPNALTEGPISKLLGELGIEYQTNIKGQLSSLPKSTLALLYRLSCEAVAFLLKEFPSNRVALTTQTETIQGTIHLRLTVRSSGRARATPQHELITDALGIHGLGLEELRTRAQLFHGDVVQDGPSIQVTLSQKITAS